MSHWSPLERWLSSGFNARLYVPDLISTPNKDSSLTNDDTMKIMRQEIPEKSDENGKSKWKIFTPERHENYVGHLLGYLDPVKFWPPLTRDSEYYQQMAFDKYGRVICSNEKQLANVIDELYTSEERARQMLKIDQSVLSSSGNLAASSKQRLLIFFPSTKRGFLACLKADNHSCPDGSHLTRISHTSEYKDRFDCIRSEDGPFWPKSTMGPVEMFSIMERRHQCLLAASSTTTKTREHVNRAMNTYKFEVYNRETSPLIQQSILQPDRLIFESRFESGNLQCAHLLCNGDNDETTTYELIMSPDLNTSRHTSWFFFKVRNLTYGRTYHFRLVNFFKEHLFYNRSGVRVLSCSPLANRQWQRNATFSIKYSRTPGYNYNRYMNKTDSYFTLSWSYKHESMYEDWCYFAHAYPYTYSMLQQSLRSYLGDGPEEKTTTTSTTVAATTRNGNHVKLITITDTSIEDSEKIGLLLTGRIHPGETHSSWIMDKILEYLLTSKEPEVGEMKSKFLIKLMPMLNPDGVILGNHRTSMAGVDLNRCYKRPSTYQHPEVVAVKDTLKELISKTRSVIFLDIHGHNCLPDVVLYGCEGELATDAFDYLRVRLVAHLLNQHLKGRLFNQKNCRFTTTNHGKEGTSRVVFWREFSLVQSFTMECSMYGYQLNNELVPFTIDDFRLIGENLLITISELYDFLMKKTNWKFDVKMIDFGKSLLPRLERNLPACLVTRIKREESREFERFLRLYQACQNLGRDPIAGISLKHLRSEADSESDGEFDSRQSKASSSVKSILKPPKSYNEQSEYSSGQLRTKRIIRHLKGDRVRFKTKPRRESGDNDKTELPMKKIIVTFREVKLIALSMVEGLVKLRNQNLDESIYSESEPVALVSNASSKRKDIEKYIIRKTCGLINLISERFMHHGQRRFEYWVFLGVVRKKLSKISWRQHAEEMLMELEPDSKLQEPLRHLIETEEEPKLSSYSELEDDLDETCSLYVQGFSESDQDYSESDIYFERKMKKNTELVLDKETDFIGNRGDETSEDDDDPPTDQAVEISIQSTNTNKLLKIINKKKNFSKFNPISFQRKGEESTDTSSEQATKTKEKEIISYNRDSSSETDDVNLTLGMKNVFSEIIKPEKKQWFDISKIDVGNCVAGFRPINDCKQLTPASQNISRNNFYGSSTFERSSNSLYYK